MATNRTFILPLLTARPGLRPVTLLEEMQLRRPDRDWERLRCRQCTASSSPRSARQSAQSGLTRAVARALPEPPSIWKEHVVPELAEFLRILVRVRPKLDGAVTQTLDTRHLFARAITVERDACCRIALLE
jgi:hypothetical protein